jgi:hypothetical protein
MTARWACASARYEPECRVLRRDWLGGLIHEYAQFA